MPVKRVCSSPTTQVHVLSRGDIANEREGEGEEVREGDGRGATAVAEQEVRVSRRPLLSRVCMERRVCSGDTQSRRLSANIGARKFKKQEEGRSEKEKNYKTG